MATDQRFGKLARRAYIAYHQDGLLDLLCGGVLLGFGVGMLSSWIGPSALWTFFIVGVIFTLLKERVTIPRIGYAEFKPDPRRETLVKIIYPVVVCTLILAMLLVYDLPAGAVPEVPVWLPSRQWPGLKLWVADKGLLLLGAASLVVFGMIGLGTGLRRMFAYGGLGLVLGVAGHIAGLETHLPVLALGGTILLVGAVVFARFLGSHPPRTGDDPMAARGSDHAA